MKVSTFELLRVRCKAHILLDQRPVGLRGHTETDRGGRGGVSESVPLRVVHLSRHKWPGGGGRLVLSESVICPLSGTEWG